MLNAYNWTPVAKQRIAILERYEPIQLYLLLELTKRIGAEIFLDIGANIGAYSVALASLDCIREVHAFEPTPLTYAEMTANIALNANATKVKAYSVALSNVTKTVTLGIVSEYSGANSIVETSIHEADKFSEQIEVHCRRADDLLPIEGKILSLKIDVEGHELQAVDGAGTLLTKNKALIQIENYDPENSALAEALSRYGYTMMFHVGPDQYFSNIEQLDASKIIAAFSAASSAMISENFAKQGAPGNHPIRIALPMNVTFEVSGPSAAFLRRTRRSLGLAKNNGSR